MNKTTHDMLTSADALRKCTGAVAVTHTEDSRSVTSAAPVINPETGTRYSRSELSAAFARVSPTPNWKTRIDEFVTLGPDADDEIMVIREAVIFYTGSVPTFTKVSESTCRVKAAGYYATIGS